MKFKNKKELIAFIVMNIAGAPFTWIAVWVFLNWYGLVGCLAIFYASYKIWKHFGNHKSKLYFSPSFTFGRKIWRV